MDNRYDIIVIGAGHAGIEAACAASRMGCAVLMVTLRSDTIGAMSCNPAIGGIGKGQLVKEIDALGGQMARAADACGIQFRTLNASKGPAVHSSRAQIDMYRYSRWMSEAVASIPGITLFEAEAEALLIAEGRVYGIAFSSGELCESSCVILCPGTFLDGRIHQGLEHHAGGRIGEHASVSLTQSLREAGFSLMRFKTGTCPRLDRKTIDFSQLTVQRGDEAPQPFSGSTEAHRFPALPQIPCFITHTSDATHRIIRANLNRSPLYTGVIKAAGVRYCPSIEDKLVRFPDKSRHQLFLEPQGLDTDEIYPNGLSTSLPEDVQEAMVRSIAGLEDARIVRLGYGIEHTVIDATQLYPSLETRPLRNLYCAGQINGTTGYEEAAGLGLIAGINAALRCHDQAPFILDRSSSYIGVLIDDLTTKGTEEPYRMFTSRVEYRLLIREDNADQRLSRYAYEFGLLTEAEFKRVEDKGREVKRGLAVLKEIDVRVSREVNTLLAKAHSAPLRRNCTLLELLKRPQLTLEQLKGFGNGRLKLPADVLKQIEIEVKYAGFVRRQLKDVERFKDLENIRLDPGLDYAQIRGLSREIQEKLNARRPLNLGQASRISGVTPAAISILMVWLHKRREQ